MTSVDRNPNFGKLQAGYLFPEIGRRRNAYLEANPGGRELISLGIGDTTQPIPETILAGLVDGAAALGTKEGYRGYGAEQGSEPLRERIADKLYGGRISANEVFVSDGAKCDIARLQSMFGPKTSIAVQDPSYPVYVDTGVMTGQTGEFDAAKSQFDGIVYMPCTPENGFFPDLDNTPRADVMYFCSPNNPTGAAATRSQLEALVAYAKKNGCLLVFDAAYAPFIRTPGTPKSIYEIEGAREVAIEVNSFSKYAGFTGVRLGWTVVPEELCFADGTPIRNDYNRVMSTGFNGASNVVQAGGLACLSDEGLKEIDVLIDYYLGNAAILREAAEKIGVDVYGGTDAPYIFCDFKRNSWDVFSEMMETCQVVAIPGAGFGPAGTNFVRLSSFASRENCEEAARRLVAHYGNE
jgi:LL-diaminopimelate aminotransferase